MPVDPSTPEPLKTALEDMEGHVQDFKESLAYAAPEVYDVHYAQLQYNLASILEELWEKTREDAS